MPMTLKETRKQLEALGNDKMRAQNTKSNAGDEMDRIVRSVTFVQVADCLNAYVVKRHPAKETLRQGWMATGDTMAARAG